MKKNIDIQGNLLKFAPNLNILRKKVKYRNVFPKTTNLITLFENSCSKKRGGHGYTGFSVYSRFNPACLQPPLTF